MDPESRALKLREVLLPTNSEKVSRKALENVPHSSRSLNYTPEKKPATGKLYMFPKDTALELAEIFSWPGYKTLVVAEVADQKIYEPILVEL